MPRLLETYDFKTKLDGIRTNKNVVVGGTLSVTGATTLTGAIGSAGVLTAVSGTAATAGGVEAVRIGSGATGVVGIYAGSGVPTATAPKGSLYLRTDGSSTSTRAYINTDAGTTWTAITTAA